MKRPCGSDAFSVISYPLSIIGRNMEQGELGKNEQGAYNIHNGTFDLCKRVAWI